MTPEKDADASSTLLSSALGFLSANAEFQKAEYLDYVRLWLDRKNAPHISHPLIELLEGVHSLIEQMFVRADDERDLPQQWMRLMTYIAGLVESASELQWKPEDLLERPEWDELRRLSAACIRLCAPNFNQLSLWELVCYLAD
jgi:hypothetical protein